MIASGTLQAATTIAKTTQTLIGFEIHCDGYDFITLYFTYTKGDETGLNIYPYLLQASTGTEYQLTEWETSSGTYTNTNQKLQFTATITSYVTIDVRGVEYIKFYQGGSDNDGTPTGTLAASYTMKG
jgi:hypothetical protein